ncbi:Chromosome transmission fidelity protein 8 [Candida viswanathii]|uniref:Chromosome transmission fidelity protein 8 n=1 Tax=Candida viswanathii TaxID=5486 RepID=A0A367XVJ1_9ASCO|nr:Chromosome transmission fidelity protein 8 [Candida viswanathii]
MPTATIDCSLTPDILSSPSDNLIFTPYGLTLLEIQGELNLPLEHPTGEPQSAEDAEYLSNFITVKDVYHAVKFGNLVFDAHDDKKVTLFIGKSQRLLGNVVKLQTPLAVMRIPTNRDEDDMDDEDDQKVKLVDIVKAKLIFKQRPLPIM